MKYSKHLPATVLAAFLLAGSSLAASSDTLYHWSFPCPEWTPWGGHWTHNPDHSLAQLYSYSNNFVPDYDYDALSISVEIPMVYDSLWIVFNHQSTTTVAGFATNMAAWSKIAVVAQGDTLWKEMVSLDMGAGTYSSSGPVNIPLDGFDPGQSVTLQLFCVTYAVAYYGYALASLDWEVYDFTIMGEGLTPLDRWSWGRIKANQID
jgi:hypothetical protein